MWKLDFYNNVFISPWCAENLGKQIDGSFEDQVNEAANLIKSAHLKLKTFSLVFCEH